MRMASPRPSFTVTARSELACTPATSRYSLAQASRWARLARPLTLKRLGSPTALHPWKRAAFASMRSLNPLRSPLHGRPQTRSVPSTVPVTSTTRVSFPTRATPSHATVAGFHVRVRVPAGRSHVYGYSVDAKAGSVATGSAVAASVGVAAATGEAVATTGEAVGATGEPVGAASDAVSAAGEAVGTGDAVAPAPHPTTTT